ncbi:MAG: glycosyltransferase [Mucispirillum sp.]|nr:glycosyltransferase [Mucispirillum sp.]
MNEPLVSIVLPAYNCEKFIKATIKSLLNQTYTNFEIIAIDDCSKDNTYDIISNFKDNRLKLFRNNINMGISKTTNKAFSLTNGKYVMQQDCDDISLPNRIELCVNFLENNPNIDGISGAEKSINDTIMEVNYKDNNGNNIIIDKTAEEIDCEQFFTGAFRNPTCMFRHEILDTLDEWYDENIKISADMMFFEKINANGFKWVTAKNVVLLYRKHSSNATKVSKDIVKNEFHKIVEKSIKRIMPNITDEELELHLKNALRKGLFTDNEADKVKIWYEKLIKFNMDTHKFKHDTWLKVLSKHYLSAMIHSYIRNPFKAWGGGNVHMRIQAVLQW